jgi:hypothetical protein
MAEKQSTKEAVEKLLDGRLDPQSQAARDISEAVAERVLRDTVTNPERRQLG